MFEKIIKFVLLFSWAVGFGMVFGVAWGLRFFV